MYSIYALVDPRDHTTRYVGVTQDVYERFSQHLRCNGSNPRKDAWIQDLRQANKMLMFTTLQEVATPLEAHVQEAYWIQHFTMLGIDLYNNMYPIPLHAKSKREQQGIRDEIQKERIESLALSPIKVDAVRQLREHGCSSQTILKKVWGVSPGSNAVYRDARDQYKRIIDILNIEELEGT